MARFSKVPLQPIIPPGAWGIYKLDLPPFDVSRGNLVAHLDREPCQDDRPCHVTQHGKPRGQANIHAWTKRMITEGCHKDGWIDHEPCPSKQWQS
jgi:hypothetical protein